jgi:hypothetical protein
MGSFKILCHEDETIVIDFQLMWTLLSSSTNLGNEAVPPDNPAAKMQYETGTT